MPGRVDRRQLLDDRMTPAAPIIAPSAPPASASTTHSVRTWRTIRPRLAPIGEPHRHLALPRRAARQQQVGDVRAHDQQDDGDRGEQHAQRRAAAAATIRSFRLCTSNRGPFSGGALAARGGRIALPMHVGLVVAARERHARPQAGDHRDAWRRPSTDRSRSACRSRSAPVGSSNVGGSTPTIVSSRGAGSAGAREARLVVPDHARIRLKERAATCRSVSTTTSGCASSSGAERATEDGAGAEQREASGRTSSRPTAARCRCWCAPSAAPAR